MNRISKISRRRDTTYGERGRNSTRKERTTKERLGRVAFRPSTKHSKEEENNCDIQDENRPPPNENPNTCKKRKERRREKNEGRVREWLFL